MEPYTITKILEEVQKGEIRIPAFQRGFVWEPDNVAFLMDSIYKGYPFGALLFWQTRERLKFDRSLGPFDLPEPREEYPIFYVLDGQQRITSIFGVFQSEVDISANSDWKDIYFDYTKQGNAQEPLFFALAAEEVDPERHFPLKTLFNPAKFFEYANKVHSDHQPKVVEMQQRFVGVQIPIQTFRTEEKSAVATIFERINRQGIPLDTLQLLSAWTWSEEFQLHGRFAELAEELEPFGFSEMSDDMNLILRCCAAILVNDASPESLMSITGEQIRTNFEKILNGIRGAVDYLQNEFYVASLRNLPFTTIMVPLSVFFAVDGNREVQYDAQQRSELNRWFWRTCFSKRYSSGVLRNLKRDIEEMVKLRDSGVSNLGNFKAAVGETFFSGSTFKMNAVDTKTFILLLASASPRTFISGSPINLQDKLRQHNKAEFHHMMPRKFLISSGQNNAISENVLANFCFISRAENRKLGGDAPSIYREKMDKAPEILAHAFTGEVLFDDNYSKFIEERSKKLSETANMLCQNP
ncbi:DUF262 domain-containing protein [Deinococcus sp. LM3]|uniref:GmrSD restriction endonuclease domain-containing protein n=1 Tax=Deinococcus sp. LM3 TaxID=1938608 RepID=UPI000991BB2F|nr:DUF262 domain-containing protein [Deinococcus sp. LM3]OOV15065.1 hypothetical protein BXU09_10785 [Deinococcus sp. LM3]